MSRYAINTAGRLAQVGTVLACDIAASRHAVSPDAALHLPKRSKKLASHFAALRAAPLPLNRSVSSLS
jgi:hypothetical protein